MKPDREYCHRCNCETNWRSTRSKSLKCEGCGDIFPCPKSRKCGHFDCAQERGVTPELPERRPPRKQVEMFSVLALVLLSSCFNPDEAVTPSTNFDAFSVDAAGVADGSAGVLQYDADIDGATLVDAASDAVPLMPIDAGQPDAMADATPSPDAEEFPDATPLPDAGASCNRVTQDCPPGYRCSGLPSNVAGNCGTPGTSQEGEVCDIDEDCAEMFICWRMEGAGTGTCRRPCGMFNVQCSAGSCNINCEEASGACF